MGISHVAPVNATAGQSANSTNAPNRAEWK